ncbi:MAG TPA: hypothetical protein VGN40_07660 [Lelliottia sp.]|jgi:hypothetical protein
MATIPTQDSVPSESPRDLKFNAGKIDEFVTSLVNTYTDRFGVQHYTIEGLRWLAQQAIAQYGWIPFGTFQAGATLTLPNQILRDEVSGEYYRWDGSLPKTVPTGSTPASTGGTGIGAWVSVGDSSLRAMLAAADGRKLIGKAPTIAALRTIEPTQNKQWIDVEKYWADSVPPQGTYWHDASDTTSADNGGTIIVTAGGKRWKFIGQPTVETYGAYADGRDDSAAFTRCIAAEDFISFPGDLYGLSSPLQPVRIKQIFQGAGTSELRIIANGNISASAFSIVLTYREGVQYRDFKISSDTPGMGFGFYSPSSIYLPNAFFKNVIFDRSLAIGINANLILCEISLCDFGLYGSTAGTFQAIRSTGQVPSGSNLTTNANFIKGCRFFRSNSAYAVDFVNGLHAVFEDCDFETNSNTAGVIRIAGLLSVYFKNCWWERNTGRSLIRIQMDSSGVAQGVPVVSVDGCWIKLETTNTEFIYSETVNTTFGITNCAGTGFSGRNLFNVNGSVDQMGYLRDFANCYFVGWSTIPQNTSFQYQQSVSLLDLRGTTGAKLGGITASSTRTIVQHDVGISFQKLNGVEFGSVIPAVSGGLTATEFRGFDSAGTQYKLRVPTGGGAATWTAV